MVYRRCYHFVNIWLVTINDNMRFCIYNITIIPEQQIFLDYFDVKKKSNFEVYNFCCRVISRYLKFTWVKWSSILVIGTRKNIGPLLLSSKLKILKL